MAASKVKSWAFVGLFLFGLVALLAVTNTFFHGSDLLGSLFILIGMIAFLVSGALIFTFVPKWLARDLDDPGLFALIGLAAWVFFFGPLIGRLVFGG